MSLSWISTTSISSCRLVDSVFDEPNQILRFVEISANTLRNYDVNTGLQIGSNVPLLTNPYAICLISPASALIGYASQSQGFSLVELSSNFRQDYSRPSGLLSSQTKGQQLAADPSLKIAFSASTTNEIVKFDGNNFTRTSIPLRMRSCKASSIIFKSSGRWLVGSDDSATPGGMIFEIDSNGAIVDSMELPRKGWVGNYFYLNGHPPAITYLSYGDNILIVSCYDGDIFIIDWSTKTIIDYFLHSVQTYGTTLSNMSDGVVLTVGCFPPGSYSTTVNELDPTIGRSHYSSNPLFLNDVSNSNPNIHIQQSTGKVIITQSNGGTTTSRLIFATLTSRASTTTTLTVQDPPGTDIKCRLWLIQDDGVGSIKILLDTIMQSPATYRVPTGKTIRAFVKYGEGNDAKYQMSVFTT